MLFAEVLNSIRTKAIEDKALDISIGAQEKMTELATNGVREYFVSVEDENISMASSEEFLGHVRELLEGVNVEFREKTASILIFPKFKIRYLYFSW